MTNHQCCPQCRKDIETLASLISRLAEKLKYDQDMDDELRRIVDEGSDSD